MDRLPLVANIGSFVFTSGGKYRKFWSIHQKGK
jgi:hypothetical protein